MEVRMQGMHHLQGWQPLRSDDLSIEERQEERQLSTGRATAMQASGCYGGTP